MIPLENGGQGDANAEPQDKVIMFSILMNYRTLLDLTENNFVI